MKKQLTNIHFRPYGYVSFNKWKNSDTYGRDEISQP